MRSPHFTPVFSAIRATALLAITGALAGACIHAGYPLGHGGSVDIRRSITGPLFAADQVDDHGYAIEPRQDPHATSVDLYITESQQAAWGAFVSVRVQPAEALDLSSATDEKSGKTCEPFEGAFRCMASKEGYARFVAKSRGDWSGEAKIVVTWADQSKEEIVQIVPAGIPPKATNFQLVVGDIDSNDRLLATFSALVCSDGPVPEDVGPKWRPGNIRSRQAYVQATAPPGTPGVLINAPVLIETLSTEAAMSLDDTCKTREARLRVLLGKTGQSDPFFLCFSDNGGSIPIRVSSGEQVIDPNRTFTVDPEPRVLRVRALKGDVELTGFPVPIDLFEISAYNADHARIAMPVEIAAGNNTVLGLDVASVILADEFSFPTIIQATPLNEGTTELHVSPQLLAMPDCKSTSVTVVSASP